MSKYTPATFQPTVRPDWAGVLSYLSDKEKSEILVALFKYPSVECKSSFWLETIKPDLDLQYQVFQESCRAKSRGVRNRWDKISITNVEDKNKISTRHVIDTERERENNINNIFNIINNNNPENNTQDNNKLSGISNNISTTRANEEKTKENFDIFWESYTPVKASDGYVVAKGSKKVAFEKYSRIIKSGVNPEDILKGLKAYIDFCQKNNRLTCGVPVFLNQERWKDEYNTPTVIAQPNILNLSARERQDLINKQKTEALLKKLREQGN